VKECVKTLNGRGVVMIPTPGGIIEIRRVQGDSRKLHITYPDGMEPVVGAEDVSRRKVLETSPLLREDEEGRIVPRFGMVVPRISKGAIDGVRVPAGLVLEDA